MSKQTSFSTLIHSDKPVLVDFSAEWCGPCKMLAPILSQVAKKVGDDARIVKIDIDKNPSIANKLKIMSVPTLILYKNGKIIWRESGVMSADQLEKAIRSAM
jgi:thioredoxin 1